MKNLEHYRSLVKGLGAEDVVVWALTEFSPARVSLASSFSIEDQALTHMLASRTPAARIFTLDTGRLFPETYDTMQATMKRYDIRIEVYSPEASAVERLTSEHGPNCFYESVELRKKCCEIRKIVPLRRALSTVDAWICGLRREQSVTRGGVDTVEWDSTHGIYKINPIVDWNEGNVWTYIREHKIPYNCLYDRGFRSIGCAPCTRAVAEGEDIRAGRWWWEKPEHKECGLHVRHSGSKEGHRG